MFPPSSCRTLFSRRSARRPTSRRDAHHPPVTRTVFTPAAALLALGTLAGCNMSEPPALESPVPAAVDDRHHEKSFSWSDPAATPGLAKLSARVTRFETAAALGEALAALNDSLQNKSFTDSLWKPVDHACDELALALWNKHGTISIGDSVVLDESVLRAGCTDIGGEALFPEDPPLGKRGASLAHPAAENDHRVHPYKMIGRSWDNFDLVVYKSTGAETQFKKHRTKLLTTAWWDTEASRIGVRAYLLNCGISGSTRTCHFAGFKTESSRNDDYVAQRDFSAGLSITYTPPKSVTAAPARLRVSDAVIGMHSADHAGIAFRATSSSGLTAATVLAAMPAPEYVTW